MLLIETSYINTNEVSEQCGEAQQKPRQNKVKIIVSLPFSPYIEYLPELRTNRSNKGVNLYSTR